MDDIYIWVAIGAIALGVAIWFDPTTRAKFRQKRFQDSPQDGETRHETLTPAPLSAPPKSGKRGRREGRKR